MSWKNTFVTRLTSNKKTQKKQKNKNKTKQNKKNKQQKKKTGFTRCTCDSSSNKNIDGVSNNVLMCWWYCIHLK